MALEMAIVAEPGLPHDLVRSARTRIVSTLEASTGHEVGLSIQLGALSMSPEGSIHWADSIDQAGSESRILLFVTELPRLQRGQPVPAEIDRTASTGIISVPAAGSVLLRRRLTRLVVAAATALASPGEVDVSAADKLAGFRQAHWLPNEKLSGRSTLVTSARLARVRLVLGMARVNRPWRLVSMLKGAMAGAAAAASFGIFYTSIWSMSSALSTRRLAMIMGLSVLVMAIWLIAGNRLWESAGPGREWRRLYNTATVITVLTGVVTMYAGLFAAALCAGLVVIDQTFMSQQLASEASLANYLVLAWLSTSMGVIAGALGSNADSYDAILRATFGNRERERRMADRPEEGTGATAPSGEI